MRLKLAALLLLIPAAVSAQGFLSGSLESNSILDDGTVSAYGGFHSNNYLKLDYSNGRFSAGLQAEWYPSPLPGYDLALQGFGLPRKFISWRGNGWDLTAGDFYGQMGSGIVFRSWEDRDLGIANSLGGIRLGCRLADDAVSLTLLSGVPRQALSYAPSLVSGADVETDVFRLLGLQGEHFLNVGGSLVNRYERTPDGDLAILLGSDAPKSVTLFSARANYAWRGITLNAEYVGKGADFTAVHQAKSSDTYATLGGRAFLADASFASPGFFAGVTYRYLYNMGFQAVRTGGTPLLSNTLNYLPALCQQQTYMLAGLNPYETYAEGESGLRGDIDWKVLGMNLHVSWSWIEGLGKVLPLRDENYLAYRDLNVSVEKRWSRKLRTTAFVSIQENSPTHGNRKATNAQNVFVLDGLYRFSRKTSLRAEVEYLFSHELTRDWMAAMVEMGFAPHWSISVRDMYNHGSTLTHYPSVTASYTFDSFKAVLAYGRTREGMVCSGGVCRYQPEFKGASLRLQWAF